MFMLNLSKINIKHDKVMKVLILFTIHKHNTDNKTFNLIGIKQLFKKVTNLGNKVLKLFKISF